MIDKTTDPDFIEKQIKKHNAQPNSVLNDPELFKLQKSIKANLKEFSFKLFGRTFRFETYTTKEVRRILECDEILCSDEAIMKRVLNDNLNPEQHAELIKISGLSYKKNVLGNKVPQSKYKNE